MTTGNGEQVLHAAVTAAPGSAIRVTLPSDPARAADILSAHLVTIYAEFLDAYIEAVRRPELAEALGRLRERLAAS